MDEEEVRVEEEVKKVILSVTSDTIQRRGAAGRNSTGKANARTSPSLLSSDEKILPHYLRASTNSCHEFCKYGKKHVFEPKKRKPNLRKDSGRSEIPAEGQKAEFSAPRGRRKKPEVKARTEPKDGLLQKPKAFEAPESMTQVHIASLEHSSFERDEVSSEESASIKSVAPSPVHPIEELSDASETTNLESCSPTEKRVISHEPITPMAWSEKSSGGSESTDLELSSPRCTPKSQVGGSLEEPLVVEILAPAARIEITARADESIRSKSAAPSSAKESLKAVPPTRSSTSSTKAQPPVREEKSSEKGLSVKLRTPSSNPRSFAGNEEGNQMKNLKVVDRKKRAVNKVKASLQLEEVSENARVIREKRIGKIAKPTVVRKATPSLVENRTVTPVKPRVSEPKSPSYTKKVAIPVSPRVAMRRTPSTIKRMDTPSKPMMPLKPKAAAVKSTPSPISWQGVSAQRNSGNKVIRSIDLSKLGEGTPPKASRASISTEPHAGMVATGAMLMKGRSLKRSSPVKVQQKSSKLETAGEKEKTLCVVESKTLKSGLKSPRKGLKKNREHLSSHASSSSSSPFSVSSRNKKENEDSKPTRREASHLVSNKEKIKRNKPAQSAKREEKRTLTRTTPAAVRAEARAPSPHKLKFRSGKIVSPMPENNTPRKLKFRKGKGTTENSNEAVRRTLRRRRLSCGSASELVAPSVRVPEVVLRHQEVQEKKDVQGLFNHVIEETANKLVETKKSKVKALVGAFETVISLQEQRVSPTV